MKSLQQTLRQCVKLQCAIKSCRLLVRRWRWCAFGRKPPSPNNALNLCLALCKHLSWQKIKTLLAEWKRQKALGLCRGTKHPPQEIRKISSHWVLNLFLPPLLQWAKSLLEIAMLGLQWKQSFVQNQISHFEYFYSKKFIALKILRRIQVYFSEHLILLFGENCIENAHSNNSNGANPHSARFSTRRQQLDLVKTALWEINSTRALEII